MSAHLNMIGLCSGDPDMVARWNAGCREAHKSELAWVEKLRSLGVKAAHPDDGWVNRQENSVHFVYPQFNDGPAEGDIICLGWHTDKSRLVKVTRVEKRDSLTSRDPWINYHFQNYTP